MSTLVHRTGLQAIGEMTILLVRHRQLTWTMALRDVSDRYAGQMLGSLWAVGHPLILMGIYIFVFSFVFQAKVGGTRELPLNYTAYLLAGLIPWLTFQEAMTKSSTAITANASLVKQVVFPIEILPIKGIMSAMLTQIIGTAILLVYTLSTHGALFWTHLLLPVLCFFQFLAMTGFCLIFATVGAYFRDMKDIVQVMSVAGMYVMPICYLPQWVPPLLRPALYVNPFSYMVWCYQDAFYFGRFEHPWAWPVFMCSSVMILAVGARMFRELKICFGSVL